MTPTFLYSILSTIAEVSIAFLFFSKFTGKSVAMGPLLFFLPAGSILISISFPPLPKLLSFCLLLFFYGAFILKTDRKPALLYAVLTAGLMQLSYGIVNSVSMILMPFFYRSFPGNAGLIFMIAGTLFSLLLTTLCCSILLRQMPAGETHENQSLPLILIPLLLILITGEYINHTVYGNTISLNASSVLPEVPHIQMLSIQLLGMISIFCTMYAWKKLVDRFFLKTKLSMLAQQARFQQRYVTEARIHYENTKALRHDMKNHIMILNRLLEKGKPEKAKAYTQELSDLATSTSFSFQTGNSVIDILLEDKAAVASRCGIQIESAFSVPSPCSVSDLDLCIILSNALDNAIHACEKQNRTNEKKIRLSSSRQEDFFFIEVENNFDGDCSFTPGTGLSNIRWTAEKYNGTMNIHTEGRQFYLSILLIISQQSQTISQQIH